MIRDLAAAVQRLHATARAAVGRCTRCAARTLRMPGLDGPRRPCIDGVPSGRPAMSGAQTSAPPGDVRAPARTPSVRDKAGQACLKGGTDSEMVARTTATGE